MDFKGMVRAYFGQVFKLYVRGIKVNSFDIEITDKTGEKHSFKKEDIEEMLKGLR
jgi:hypothetical protein